MFPQIDEMIIEQHYTIPPFVWIFLVVGIVFILGSCLASLLRCLASKKSTRTDQLSRLPSICSHQPTAPSVANLQVGERQFLPDSFILMQQSQSTDFVHDPPPKYSDVVHQESSVGPNGRFNFPAIIEVERTTSSPPEFSPPASSPPEYSRPESFPPEFLPPPYSPPECSRPESSPPEFSPPVSSPPECSRPESSPEFSPPVSPPPECSRPESSPPEFSPPASSPPECSRPESSPPKVSPSASSLPESSPPAFSPENFHLLHILLQNRL